MYPGGGSHGPTSDWSVSGSQASDWSLAPHSWSEVLQSLVITRSDITALMCLHCKASSVLFILLLWSVGHSLVCFLAGLVVTMVVAHGGDHGDVPSLVSLTWEHSGRGEEWVGGCSVDLRDLVVIGHNNNDNNWAIIPIFILPCDPVLGETAPG